MTTDIEALAERTQLEHKARLVFDHWRTVMNSPHTNLSPDRKEVIIDRLREGWTVGELKYAIDGCASSNFHMGQNDRQAVYNQITIIFRDTEHVERFIRYAEVKGKPRYTPEGALQTQAEETTQAWRRSEKTSSEVSQ